ncbi:FHA domain-containing protein [Psychrobacter sp. H8-1]|uniref:FHA domain-containing protein n=1 Tax=Psychrobacter sp. H8-1 TaxID=2774129 RepID=UPI00191A0B0F|nr:FHA domain-containing protein [Psychrobacter sp. H8-1]
MTNNSEDVAAKSTTWQLNALTEALGDLTLTVSDSLTVGRGSDNNVVLGSKQVSRNHALLSVLNGNLYLKDLGSSNGTFINDERLEGNKSKQLKTDDKVGFASFSFVVSKPVAATETQQPAPIVSDETMPEVEPATEIAPAAESDTAAQPTEVTDVVVDESQVALKPTAPIDAEPVVQEPVSPEPVVKKTVVEEILPTDDSLETTPIVDEVKAEPVGNAHADKPMVEEPVSPDPVVEKSAVEEPVVKETGIEEVLADKRDTTPVETEPAAAASTTTEQAVVTPEASIEKSVDEELVTEKASTEQPTISPEQDKTTTTTLQEEADPDVLRAKQAATAQFSGTANLGQPRDIGTEGNNALDQALNNPANAGQPQKKSSGSWFVWVFAIIIIIALALWLFNTGSV